MTRAFIFDMDGVIINSEQAWRTYGADFLPNLFGEEIARAVGDTIGMTVDMEYAIAASYGFSMDRKKYYELYDRQAFAIYDKANITEGLEELVGKLVSLDYRIGLVSSSRRPWIEKVLGRLAYRDCFQYVISVNDAPELRPKPEPDGYLCAMRELGARPERTIILEDSNSGIKAAKAAGALAVGLRQNLVDGYEQTGADMYAETMYDLIEMIVSFPSKEY
jgi:HAD superfamily hydrolase (TIGR01509 family)